MTINDELLEIHNKLLHIIEHPYLKRHLPQPEIDRDRLYVYYLLFKENGSYSDVEDYIISIMLVQIALDTHETVTTERLSNQDDKRTRQLTVLSGIYHSSLYYYILAKTPDVQMIKWIAKGIQDFNEYKMRFFVSEHLQWNYLFEQLGNIESALLSKVTQALGMSDWNAALHDYFYLKRLNIEKKAFLNGEKQTSFFHHIFKKKPDYRKIFIQKIDQCIQETVSRLKDHTNHPSQSKLINTLLQHISKETSVNFARLAEEG
ncbi:heptaprenyl diphosphate synthase [Scopulibacillus darangshiensis]|uniref:Heptaprenyl diphosphate synthase n=1 Tax=Scopulibacillus darangshiensis TaxID=442528 RepID=A0A4R2PB77_9BACL|nr:heptaprenyl diphosphate synthase component 1 [Scopulibacillus darangshiensis]TCP31648.1 heptaprenyl diphosphate synthase [Scopulibacillus darangshiensis]